MAQFNRLSFEAPAGWLDASEIQLIERDPRGSFPASIQVNRMSLDDELSVEQLGEILKQGIEQSEECELLESTVVEIEGRSAHRMEYRMMAGEDRVMRRLQAAFIIDGECLLLACTGPENAIVSHEPIFRQAVASFSVGSD